MPSLIDTVRTKFLEAIRSVQPPTRWKILVVDPHSQKLLGSVLKQFDILEENVTQIEAITNYREPQTGFEAIYLLMPTTQNVDRIMKDFVGNTPQYAGAHLFFLDRVKDLFLNLWATESQAYSLQAPELFFSMFSPPPQDKDYRVARDRIEEHVVFVARIIANLCITLDEFPFIRYYFPQNHPPLGALRPNQTTRPPPPAETATRWRTNLARGDQARQFEAVETDFVTRLIAFKVQALLEENKKANPDFAKPQTPPRPRATLIITDRSMDMLAPFIHEFTFQAMANDLLPIKDGTKYTYKFQSSKGAYEDKTATLSDADNVWTEVRHMHMREAIDKLMADFNKFVEEHAVFNGEGAASLSDMKDMLASLPQYQDQREKFSLHLNIAQECMGIFERDNLPAVANIEQCCATGLTAEGKTPKTLIEEMVPILDSRDVVNLNKVRVIALYIQYRDGVPEEDRRRLYQHARLSLAEQDAVNALAHMGVKLNRGPGDKDSKKKLKQKPTDDDYDLSRFKPLLKTMVEDNVANRLDQVMFPYVKESPASLPPPTTLRAHSSQSTSLRSQKPAWHRAPKPAVDNRERLLLFVAGGMTYSEIREAYQLSNTLNRDIYIGATHTINPRHFIDDLKVLDLGGKGSRAAPQGLSQESRGPRRGFQEYYDERYYTEDAPRPPPPPAQKLPLPREDRRGAPAMSPAPSFGSATSSLSGASSTVREKEKKKKKGLFRF
ncbi:Sec1-like protein [Schizophyllum amplum]|uniref:Sec1-like protein n=1 Tax=Schizophyllum amplum TaxID=97359 RepID=A0A550CLB5_9AGAR|nr:Sec1-like protein [Auriculariopsis ampla]